MKMQKMKRRLWHAETLWSVSAEEKERARPFLFIYFFYLLQKISHKPTHVRSHSHGERASHLQFNCHVQLSIMMTGFWTQKGGWQITSKPQEPFKTPKSLIEERAFHWVVVKYKKKQLNSGVLCSFLPRETVNTRLSDTHRRSGGVETSTRGSPALDRSRWWWRRPAGWSRGCSCTGWSSPPGVWGPTETGWSAPRDRGLNSTWLGKKKGGKGGLCMNQTDFLICFFKAITIWIIS